MVEQIGHSVAALQARQAAVGSRHTTVAAADRVLAAELTGAHAATVQAVSRIDAIAAEIESAVQNQAALALDTPLGAHEFHKLLNAKQREIIAIVCDACQLGSTKIAALQTLRTQYATFAG
jgi:hypothetical protein